MSKIDQINNYQFTNMIKGVEREYNKEFQDGYIYDEKYLYEEDFGEILSPLLSSLHYWITNLFESLNDQIKKNRYFWANPSRQLVRCIDISYRLLKIQPLLDIGFKVDEYYLNIFKECKNYLRSSGGSQFSDDFEIIDILYTIPIFKIGDSISKVSINNESHSLSLNAIGEGSYAKVFSYHDNFYNKDFVLKRAKSDLDTKEVERFYREYEIMDSLNSPYVIEVYRLDKDKREYIMECADFTILDFVKKNNNILSIDERKNLSIQIIKAFEYLDEKNILHRDISPNNILIKEYDNVKVIKVADFGLVKLSDSELTAIDTEIRGYFNDISNLSIIGFDKYDKTFEYYALTKLLYFILTGRYKRMNKFPYSGLQDFLEIGLNSDLEKRYKSVQELKRQFLKIQFQ